MLILTLDPAADVYVDSAGVPYMPYHDTALWPPEDDDPSIEWDRVRVLLGYVSLVTGGFIPADVVEVVLPAGMEPDYTSGVFGC
jgi:hypothetical protein